MRPLRGETGTPSRGRGPTTPAREARPRATAAVAPHTASVAARSAARHAPANRGVAGCRPPTHAAQQPAAPPSTPPRIDFRRRHTQGHAHSTGASRRTHLPVPSPPYTATQKVGCAPPQWTGPSAGATVDHRPPPPIHPQAAPPRQAGALAAAATAEPPPPARGAARRQEWRPAAATRMPPPPHRRVRRCGPRARTEAREPAQSGSSDYQRAGRKRKRESEGGKEAAAAAPVANEAECSRPIDWGNGNSKQKLKKRKEKAERPPHHPQRRYGPDRAVPTASTARMGEVGGEAIALQGRGGGRGGRVGVRGKAWRVTADAATTRAPTTQCTAPGPPARPVVGRPWGRGVAEAASRLPARAPLPERDGGGGAGGRQPKFAESGPHH